MVSPVVVANNFIKRAMNESVSLSPMKSQKLIYFLYRDYLKSTGNRLFTEPFQAWQYGPVVTSVYEEFRTFGGNDINRFARNSMGDVFTVEEKGKFKESFDRVWNNYAMRSAWDLSMMTHRPGSAWSKTVERHETYLEDEDIKNE